MVPCPPRTSMQTLIALILWACSAFMCLAQETTGTQNGTPFKAKQLSQLYQGNAKAIDFLERYPLAPLDTSSPRATLESFTTIMDEASKTVLEAYQRSSLSPIKTGGSLTPSSDVQGDIRIARLLFNKATETLNLSQIPQAERQQTGLEVAMLMKEVLDRLPLPDPESIPGKAAGLYDYSQKDLPDSWRIPFSRIIIGKQTEGPNAGSYTFTPQTVAAAYKFYNSIKVLPNKQGSTDDFFNFYKSSPEGLLPPAWFELVRQQGDWIMQESGGLALWQWIGLAGSTVVAVLFLWLLTRIIGSKRKKTEPFGKKRISSLLMPVICLSTLQAYQYVAINQINVTGQVRTGLSLFVEAVSWLVLSFIVYRLINLIAQHAITRNINANKLDQSILRTGFYLLSIVAVLAILAIGATRIGIPLYGVIAGLSVSGLALALAAQPTMENLLGGINLYADDILRIGDFCKFGETMGTVEQIGIRSTRIRSKDRTLTTITNADLAKMKITNYTKRDRNYMQHIIGLRYETSPDQIRKILLDMRNYIIAHPKTLTQTVRVRLVEFADCALNIEVKVEIKEPSYDKYLGIQEDILLSLYEIIEDNGSDFAFPSTTTYFAKDTGLNAERKEFAEGVINNLRSTSDLPFPDTPEMITNGQEKTGFWPPKDSALRKLQEISKKLHGKDKRSSKPTPKDGQSAA
ncbi:mechanosensitive ion channel family protein [Flexibacterium corallicola]|uniref:mechanosensitive ion channel family protein n=1 Tax=Flexibacterium corallicola TaxID=3037259 RepID=UPI00286F2A75|nr:mechanosensitive ion channel family protein [Pseudovibrio sp. M1P-2-3]